MAELKRAGMIFDFDDTLVYAHEQFQLAEKQFALHMLELGLYDEKLLNAARERDIANVRRAGYLATDCFPTALVETYESYCAKYRRQPDAAVKRQLLLLGYQPYINPPRPLEGAKELLRQLRLSGWSKRSLILFTQGEQKIQRRRLRLSGLRGMFGVIEIVREKNDAALQALLKKQRLEPSLSWYVGNSLRHDINPAIRAGLNAVHLNTAGWSYEDEEPGGFYHSISHLGQLTAILEQAGVAR